MPNRSHSMPTNPTLCDVRAAPGSEVLALPSVSAGTSNALRARGGGGGADEQRPHETSFEVSGQLYSASLGLAPPLPSPRPDQHTRADTRPPATQTAGAGKRAELKASQGSADDEVAAPTAENAGPAPEDLDKAGLDLAGSRLAKDRATTPAGRNLRQRKSFLQRMFIRRKKAASTSSRPHSPTHVHTEGEGGKAAQEKVFTRDVSSMPRTAAAGELFEDVPKHMEALLKIASRTDQANVRRTDASSSQRHHTKLCARRYPPS